MSVWKHSTAAALLGALTLIFGATDAQAQADAASPETRSLPIRSRHRAEPAESALRIENIASPQAVGRYDKLEIRFTVAGGTATVPLWPYDPQSPAGVDGEQGVSAYAMFRHESGAEYRQPAFLYQEFRHETRDGRDWVYPAADTSWMVRFSPHQAGRWSYTLHVVERAGSAQSTPRSFETLESSAQGFVRVSRDDPRYFQLDDGSLFHAVGMQLPENLNQPRAKAGPLFDQLAGSGVNLARMWISSLFGSAWMPYIGGRNQYRGYLPNAGLVPVTAAPDPQPQFAMMLDWNQDGDTGWFDACRLLGRDSLDAVLPETQYLVSVEYAAWGVEGPRDMRSPGFGLVVKEGSIREDCYQPGVGVPITGYAGAGEDGVWRQVSGVWSSRDAEFLPTLQIALENVTAGYVFIRSISVRELRADGSLGPEILTRPNMDYTRYVSSKLAYQFDRIVEMAEQAGVRLKLVIAEKGDELWLKLNDDGSYASEDNPDGFFGVGRQVNRTRWLQRAWWRYLQARWGYSPAVHSWELLNEGDPGSEAHFALADELGRYMKYGVFGLDPDDPSTQPHPNAHMVTTSFWHSFPCEGFWRNERYRFVDYADLHAYVSTSRAPLPEREAMQFDAAYYHLWHSQSTASCAAGKPVVRGEAGLDSPERQSPTALGIERDADKLWLHNFVWSTLDAGAMGEIYWWSQHLLDGDRFHLEPFRRLTAFLADIELHKGGYENWSGTAGSEELRVVGQKNTAAGRMHLWIQNRASTWSRGTTPDPVDAEAVAPGFPPGAAYRVEYWDTRSAATAVDEIEANARGELAIPVQGLRTDVAVKVSPRQP